MSIFVFLSSYGWTVFLHVFRKEKEEKHEADQDDKEAKKEEAEGAKDLENGKITKGLKEETKAVEAKGDEAKKTAEADTGT